MSKKDLEKYRKVSLKKASPKAINDLIGFWKDERAFLDNTGLEVMPLDYIIRDLKQFLSEILEEMKKNNPYPKDIFIEPTQDEWKQIRYMLKENGFSLDKVSGSIGRRVWNICCEDFKTKLLGEKG